MAELTRPGARSDGCAEEARRACCEPADKTSCGTTGAARGSCGCAACRAPVAPLAGQADIREAVRARCAAAARAVSGQPVANGCCGPAGTPDAGCAQAFGARLYDGADVAGATAGAVAASLGLWRTTAVADLHESETVLDLDLDLGSGAGADVLIAARRVGPAGRAGWT